MPPGTAPAPAPPGLTEPDANIERRFIVGFLSLRGVAEPCLLVMGGVVDDWPVAGSIDADLAIQYFVNIYVGLSLSLLLAL